jgi:hypothetical protein
MKFSSDLLYTIEADEFIGGPSDRMSLKELNVLQQSGSLTARLDQLYLVQLNLH